MNPELICLLQDYREDYGDDIETWSESVQEEFYYKRNQILRSDLNYSIKDERLNDVNR